MVPRDAYHKKTVVVHISSAAASCTTNIAFVDLANVGECLIHYQAGQFITADTTHDLSRAQ